MAKRKKKAPPAPPQNGIRELVWVEPTSLDENPLNWRKHPQRQTDAIGASIKANGWADTLLFNENTQRLIDGHARRQVAIEEGIDSVPVLIGWWTEEQEKHLLTTLDPLASMADTDAEALLSLTDSLSKDQSFLDSVGDTDRDILNQLTQSIDDYAHEALAEEDDEEEEDHHEYEVRDDSIWSSDYDEEAIFYSSNEWGLPDYMEDMFCETIPSGTWDRDPNFNVKDPGTMYCHSARTFPDDREGGILMFYTEDYRFESCWNTTGKMTDQFLAEEWTALGPPAYSTWWDWPLIVRLHSVYRCRWIQRFWQEAGLKIIPDLYWDDTEASLDWGLSTLPSNLPVASVECRTINRHGGDWKRFREGLEEVIARISPQTIMIYGGGGEDNRRHLKKLPSGTNYVLLDSYMGGRRKQMKKNKSK